MGRVKDSRPAIVRMDVKQIQRAAVEPPRSADAPDISVIMPTTAWGGVFETCARRVLDLLDEAPCASEFVVVYDGAMPDPPPWLLRPDVRILSTREVRGPAAARNLGADQARAGILFFVDADVELAADALGRVHAALAGDDAPVALFGAYDDAPADPRTVSRFRNLLHHHIHVTHPGEAGTFWAGCGAVRSAHFHDVGGFDERYATPSIEDVELGTRIAGSGGRIVLDPLLQGKHHKAWSLRSMVATDIVCRAIPWTRLILTRRHLPRTLNTAWTSRASGVLALTALAAAVTAVATAVATAPAAVSPAWPIYGALAAAACVAGVVFLNARFYRLCLRRHGPGFAVAAVGLHLLFYCYASLTFGWVVLASLIPGGVVPGDAPVSRRRGPAPHAAGMGSGAESWTA